MNRYSSGFLLFMIALFSWQASNISPSRAPVLQDHPLRQGKEQQIGVPNSRPNPPTTDEQEFGRQLKRTVCTAASGTTSDCENDSGEMDIPGGAEFLVADVPDPARTHLALMFDRTIEAIEQAADAEHWAFDRARMPWDNEQHPDTPDVVVRDYSETFQRMRERWPGIMLFRRATEKASDKAWLIVSVVSERPTRGISRIALSHTLELIRFFNNGTVPVPLYMLGPTFTGSMPTVEAFGRDLNAVGGCPDSQVRQPELIAYSGTVTDAGTIRNIQSRDARSKCGDLNWLEFESFQENDDYVLAGLLRHIERLHYCPADVAVLSEDETSYGGAPIPLAGSGAGQTCATDRRDKVLELRFPREMSHLRAAYQSLAAASVDKDKPPTTTLPVDFEKTGNDEDTVVSYSEKQMPLSQEAVMLGIIGELRAHRIRFVVIRATDPLDQLFLAEFFRKTYPNGRVVVVGTDLLFAREIQDNRLHGIMALTTYPDLPYHEEEASYGVTGQRRERVFPSHYSAGTYNALRALLQTASGVQPHDWRDLYGYKWPNTAETKQKISDHPPVYITTLGNDGFWPVDVLEMPVNSHSSQSTIARSLPVEVDVSRVHVTRIWLFYVALILSLCVVYLFCIFSGSMLDTEDGVAHFTRSDNDRRASIFCVMAILLVAALQIAVWPYISPKVMHSWRTWSLIALLELTTFAMITATGYDIRLRTPRLPHKRNFWVWATRGGGIAVVLLTTTFTLFTRHYYSVAFIYRGTHLFSGVSPALPILLLIAAGLWWGWHTIAGCTLEAWRPKLPSQKSIVNPRPASTGISTGGGAAVALARNPCQQYRALQPLMQEDHQVLENLMQPATWDSRVHLVTLGLMLIAFELIPDLNHPIFTLEPRKYSWLLTSLLLAALTLLTGTVLRLRRLWRELRWLLIALDSKRLRRGFFRVRGFSSRPVWQMGVSSLGAWQRLLSREFEALRGAVKMCAFDDKGVLRTLEPLREAVDAARTAKEAEIKDIGSSFMKSVDTIKNWFHHALATIRRFQTPRKRGSIHASKGVLRGSNRVAKKRNGGPPSVYRWAKKQDVLHSFRTIWNATKTLVVRSTSWEKIDAALRAEHKLAAAFEDTQVALADAVGSALMAASDSWENEIRPITEFSMIGLKDEKSEELSSGELQWSPVRIREHFICLHYVNYVQVVIIRIRSLVMAISGLYVLTLFAVSVYPFEPSVAIRTIMALVLLAAVAIVASVYAGMHRDPVLSYISDTPPGELGSEFWLRMASFIALPLISLATAQFPEMSRFLFSWIEPALQALH